jgi:hypothetical protein
MVWIQTATDLAIHSPSTRILENSHTDFIFSSPPLGILGSQVGPVARLTHAAAARRRAVLGDGPRPVRPAAPVLANQIA